MLWNLLTLASGCVWWMWHKSEVRLSTDLCCIHLGAGANLYTEYIFRFLQFDYRFCVFFLFSRYCSMTYIVDQLFPPIKYDEVPVEFSNFNYWRDPIPDLPELDTALVPASTKVDIATLRPIPEKWIMKRSKRIANNAKHTLTLLYSLYRHAYITYLIPLWSFLLGCTSSWHLCDYPWVENCLANRTNYAT